jgi:hypothetical protein
MTFYDQESEDRAANDALEEATAVDDGYFMREMAAINALPEPDDAEILRSSDDWLGEAEAQSKWTGRSFAQRQKQAAFDAEQEQQHEQFQAILRRRLATERAATPEQIRAAWPEAEVERSGRTVTISGTDEYWSRSGLGPD